MAQLTLKFVTDADDHEYEVVEFHGELDQSTLSDMEKQVAEALKTFTGKYLVFDLGDLNFINSEGIGFMLATHKQLDAAGRRLILCSMKKNVSEVMGLIGIPQLVKTFDYVQDAINYIKKS